MVNEDLSTKLRGEALELSFIWELFQLVVIPFSRFFCGSVLGTFSDNPEEIEASLDGTALDLYSILESMRQIFWI